MPRPRPFVSLAPPASRGRTDTNRGPVLITVEYEIALDRREAFLDAMQQLGAIRRRDGAFGWGIFENLAMPGCYIEAFSRRVMGRSSASARTRVTREDQRVQEIVHQFHIGSRTAQGFALYRWRPIGTHGSFNGNMHEDSAYDAPAPVRRFLFSAKVSRR